MVKIVHWNPYRRVGRSGLLRKIPLPKRVDNFGDLLGPWIVERLRQTEGLADPVSRRARLLSVGSIMHFARAGDVVWGTGVNGKIPLTSVPPLDVRAVRGPRTAEKLRAAGLDVPPVYGDPALLVPHLVTDESIGVVRGSGGTVFVPNLHDRKKFPAESLDPRGDLLEKVREIASATLVVSSSLHGIVIAEAYGVRVLPVVSGIEPVFKYADYFEGTGRVLPRLSDSWASALATNEAPPPLEWSPDALLAAFPRDLWSPRDRATAVRR